MCGLLFVGIQSDTYGPIIKILSLACLAYMKLWFWKRGKC